MRPVTLDMNGFASFREAATIDFTDADFFALVGPTGSGKSTVIDAMTFALYGSVPRWGRKGMVSLALAPTVARGTVKLVFEVDKQRYVVARELRRAGGTVSQRAASLERLADPRGLARPGDQTFPMAKDLDGVNEAVEKLLGLKYDNFIQCVVLPQNQFAVFLHAKPAERQDILLRLLGAEHYRLMMMKANQRDKMAGLRAGTYGEELLGYADATPEAERSARAAEAALAGLGERVTATLPLISAKREELKAADDYYLGAFLVGAYQETLGDLHNLFGDTHVVHIKLHDEGGWWIEEVVKGDTANKVLEYMEYDVAELAPALSRDCERAVREGRLTVAEAQALKRFYETELNGYAYLEP